MKSRNQYLKELRREYLKLRLRKEKSKLLNEAEKRAKLERKYLIKKLRPKSNLDKEPGERKKRKEIYDGRIKAALVQCWNIFDYPCGLRLEPLLKTETDRLKKLGELQCSYETIEKLKIIRTGWKLSEETKKKLSEIHKGSRNYSWKGGVTPLRVKIWHSPEYKLWRRSVFERDNYTCVFCGKRGGRLAADHIKSFREYLELRFLIDNGRTLCKDCHFKTETYGKWK